MNRRPICLCSIRCVFITSLIFSIFGVLLLTTWPAILDAIWHIIFVLKPNTRTFDLWVKTPFSIDMNVYVFNWTNPYDIKNHSRKMRLQQLGPYTFEELKNKVNLAWHETNGTVTYQTNRTWHFNGNGNLQDSVTTVNPLALSSAYMVRNWNYVLRKGFSFSLSAVAKLQVTKTVGQMLFEGYNDPLIDMGKNMPFSGQRVPNWDRFGWFYTRNGSESFDGVFNMGTGQQGTEFGRLYNWNYMNQTHYFPDHCGRIFGSAGEFFPSKHTLGDKMHLFVPEICRPITLDYESDVLIQNIVGRKYSAGPSFLDNGYIVPENKCLCGDDECVPYGAINVASCRYNTPSFVSLPHFFKADPYYVEHIDGLHPNRTKHDLYIVVEPNTGIVLEVAVRIQINLLLQSIPSITLLQDVPKVYVPMIWLEEVVQIPPSMASQLKILVYFPQIALGFGTLVLFSGILLIFVTIYRLCTMNLCGKTDRRQYPLIYQQVPLRNNNSIISEF